MTQKGLAYLYNKIDNHHRLFPKGINQITKISNINLKTNILDFGGLFYGKQQHESSNILFKLVDKELHPNVILDIGANYGYISICMAQWMPYAKLIAVEPNKKLIPYIVDNFDNNNIYNYQIINAVCGILNSVYYPFYINHKNSQSCRVSGEATWQPQSIPMLTMDKILRNCQAPIFIKTDTEGYEEHVVKGGYGFLSSNKQWLMRMEFSPSLLRLNDTNPDDFLYELVSDFDVTELPSIIPYYTKSINDLFQNKIKVDIRRFVQYVENLQEDGKGWLDLLVKPK